MARERSLKITRINIVTHPHSPQDYLKLMRKVFNEAQSVPVRGDQHLMIGQLRYIDTEDHLKGMFGKIYRFIQIDRDAPWFNVVRNDIATEEELALINIPNDLRPNCEQFDFVFYPRGHAFYLESKSTGQSLSPNIAAKMLSGLFANPTIREEFGEVEVNVFADRQHLETIIHMHDLRRLVIKVTKPNADELGRAQAKVFGRLCRWNARKATIDVTAEKDESIEVDAILKIAARVAAAGNGKVEGFGYDNGGARLEESTVNKPWDTTVTYNPNVQTQETAMIAATANLPGHD